MLSVYVEHAAISHIDRNIPFGKANDGDLVDEVLSLLLWITGH